MNVSVPYQYTAETEPNVSSTQWRSFANLTDRLYYFDIVTNPGLVYVDLGKMDLRAEVSPSGSLILPRLAMPPVR